MSSSLQLMVEGAIEELHKAEFQGILISDLFDHLDLFPSSDENSKDKIWEALLNRDDVLVYRHEMPLNKSPFLKLGYKDALDLGLGDRKLIFKPQDETTIQVLSPEDSHAESKSSDIDSRAKTAQNSKPDGISQPAEVKRRRGRPPKFKNNDPPQTPVQASGPRRRGRPPKVKLDDASNEHSQGAAISVSPSSTAEQPVNDSFVSSSVEITPAPLPKRVPKPKIRYEPPLKEKATPKAKTRPKSALASVVSVSDQDNSVFDSTRQSLSHSKTTPSLLPSYEGAQQSHIEAGISNTEVDPRNFLDNLQTVSPGTESAPAAEEEEPQLSTVLLESSEEYSTTISLKAIPVLLSDSEIVSNGASGGTTTSDVPEIIPEATYPILPTVPSTVRQHFETPDNRSAPEKESTFANEESSSIQNTAPSEDVLLEDRKAGISINPPGSERQFPRTRGRPPKSVVAVFRSKKLKNPQWFEQQKGMWIQPVATVVALNRMVAEDSPKKKRKYIKQKAKTSIQTDNELDSEIPAISGLKQNKPAAEDEASATVVPPTQAFSISDTQTDTCTGERSESHLIQGVEISRQAEENRDEPRAKEDSQHTPESLKQSTANATPAKGSSQEHTSDTEVAPQRSYSLLRASTAPSRSSMHAALERESLQATSEEPTTSSSDLHKPPSIVGGVVTSKNLFPPSLESEATPLSLPNQSNIVPSHSYGYYRSPYGDPLGSSTNLVHSKHQQPVDPTRSVSFPAPNQTTPQLGAVASIPQSSITQLNTQYQSILGGRKETESLINSYRSPFKPVLTNASHNSHTENHFASSAPSVSHLSPTPIPYFENNSGNQPSTPVASHGHMNQHSVLQHGPYINSTVPAVQPHGLATQGPGQDTRTFSHQPSAPIQGHASPLNTNQINSRVENTFPVPQDLYDQPRMSFQNIQPMLSVQRSSDEPPRGYFISTPISDPHSTSQRIGGNKRKLSQVDSTVDRAELSIENGAQKKQKTAPTSRQKASIKKPATDQDSQLQKYLDQAEAIPVQDRVTRFPCMYQDKVGNLLLSEDMTTLEFISLEQYPPQMPFLTIAVSEIPRNPITSAAGSKPMELRIKSKFQGSNENLHCFAFLDSPQGIEAVTNMRAKIVTALTALEFQPGTMSHDVQKPYKCEKCESRFRNKNGLEYHVTKSFSTCNPNFDPSKHAPRNSFRGRPRGSKTPRRKKQDVAGDVSAYTPRGAPSKLNEEDENNQPSTGNEGMVVSDKEADDDSDSSTTSEDSVIEWFKTHAINGPARRNSSRAFETPSKPTKQKLKTYKALPREALVMREIIEEYKATFLNTSPDEPYVQSNIEVANEIESFAIHPGALDEEEYQKLLIAIINKNNNMFSGDKSLWIACVTIWLKKHRAMGLDIDYKNAPEFKLCCKIVDNLVAAKKLEKHLFTFVDKTLTRPTIRHFFTVPGTEIDTPRVQMLKELIKASYPGVYIPTQFSPTQTVLDKLQVLAGATIARVTTESDDEFEIDELPNNEDFDDISSDEDFFDEAQQESVDTESGSEGSLDENQSQPITPRRGRSNSTGTRLKRNRRHSRSITHNDAISNGLRKYWDAVRENGGNFHPYSGETLSRPMKLKPKFPLSQQEKDRRALKVQVSKTTWFTQFSHTSSFMPNPETGAWDQGIKNTQISSPKKGRKGQNAGRKVNRRPRIPEPVTYLQAENGAWSVRPFGHGVNPIYSRPARRAYGNPALDSYLTKIQNGFRPIIYPTKNRLFLPAAASKQFLDSVRAGKPSIEDSVRISKITGLPVRKWVKKENKPERSQLLGKRKRHASNEDEDDEDQDFQLSDDSESSKRPRKRYTRQRRSIDELLPTPEDTIPRRNEVSISTRAGSKFEMVDLFEPKKLEVGARQNPGLDSVPYAFGFDISRRTTSNKINGDFLHPYPQVNFQELNIIQDHHVFQENSYFADSLWITSLPTYFKSEDYKVRWNDQNAFNVDTLPYDSLVSDDENDSLEQDIDVQAITRPKKRNRWSYRRDVEQTASEDSLKVTFTRSHTHLTTDFEGIYKNAKDIATTFNVQVAQPNDAKKRRQRNLTHMTPQQETRFIIAVIVIRTLTGGVDLLVDWVLMATIFKKYAMSYLQKRWSQINLRMKPTIDRLTTDFKEPFLNAYEKGEVESIDFDNLVNYNWNKLINWVMKNIDTHLGRRRVNIPNSRKELGNLYYYNEVQRDVVNRDILFHPSAAVYRRIEVASAESNSIPIHQMYLSPEMDELAIAKSWVRVVALTPEDHWDLEAAKTKLDELGLPLVTAALQSLTDGKVIMHRAKGRVTPGRSYEATDAFSSAFRKTIREPRFVEAVTFKRYLDSEFRKGNVGIRAEYLANEGTVLAITSMQAHRRIILVPTGVPMNKFGLTDGGYETRTIPKERLRFEMDIFPTDTYIYDDENEIVNNALEFGPPRGNPEAIPIWFGVSERVNAEIWKNVVTAVGQTLALRAGADVQEVTRLLKPSMEEWEVKLVLDWGTDLGLWKKLHDTIEGWMAAEWWWLLAGKWCVDST